MLAYPFWPQLYYREQGLYPFLQGINASMIPTTSFTIPCRSAPERAGRNSGFDSKNLVFAVDSRL
nr:hypothetical protein [uncultured bacterium]